MNYISNNNAEYPNISYDLDLFTIEATKPRQGIVNNVDFSSLYIYIYIYIVKMEFQPNFIYVIVYNLRFNLLKLKFVVYNWVHVSSTIKSFWQAHYRYNYNCLNFITKRWKCSKNYWHEKYYQHKILNRKFQYICLRCEFVIIYIYT